MFWVLEDVVNEFVEFGDGVFFCVEVVYENFFFGRFEKVVEVFCECCFFIFVWFNECYYFLFYFEVYVF